MSQTPAPMLSVKNYLFSSWIVDFFSYTRDLDSETRIQILWMLIGMVVFMLFIFVLYVLILKIAAGNVNQFIKLEKKLILDEKRFLGMAQHIPSGLIILENYLPVFYNKAFTEIFEITDPDLEQFDLSHYLIVEDKDRFNLLYNKAVKEQRVFENVHFQTISNQNTSKEISCSCSFEIRDQIQYTYLLFTDVSESSAYQSRIKSLSQTIDQSPDSTIITDVKGKIVYVNRKFEKLTGYSSQEVLGQNPRFLKSDKMPPSFYTDLWKTITSGNIWENEMLNKKKDGSLFWEHTIIFPIRNESNEIINYAAIKTDLTKQKQLENELIESKEQAKIGESIKLAFLHNVSHEVRTPLNAIYGFSTLLKKEFRKTDTAFEYLSIVAKNSEILLKLFDDIIDYSTIETGDIKIVREEFPIYPFIQKLASRHNTKITTDHKKPIDIVVEINQSLEKTILTTDKHCFTRILDNLITNAIKYTQEGSIHVGFSIDHENIRFYIRDSGVGISEVEKTEIFNTFTHGKNHFVSLHKGTGLGLNIARALVHYLGGQLWFTSELGVGSTFFFILPSMDAKNYLIGEHLISHADSLLGFRGKKVLIAEDNVENFLSLKSLLNLDLSDIAWAKTGHDVLDILENETSPFDLIFMDVLMPDLDGINTTKAIQNIRKVLPPIIAITSPNYTISSTEKRMFSAIITKPFQKNMLYETIQRVILSSQQK